MALPGPAVAKISFLTSMVVRDEVRGIVMLPEPESTPVPIVALVAGLITSSAMLMLLPAPIADPTPLRLTAVMGPFDDITV